MTVVQVSNTIMNVAVLIIDRILSCLAVLAENEFQHGDVFSGSVRCPAGMEMLQLCSVRSPTMNRITLEDTREALRQTRYKVEVPGVVR